MCRTFLANLQYSLNLTDSNNSSCYRIHDLTDYLRYKSVLDWLGVRAAIHQSWVDAVWGRDTGAHGGNLHQQQPAIDSAKTAY